MTLPAAQRPPASTREYAMTDFHHAATLDEIDAIALEEEPLFYVVSKRKFVLLYLATLGMYGAYWFYKNWARYNKISPHASKAGNGVWPLPRAVFAVFFVHSLFAKIKAYGSVKLEVGAWQDRSHATVLVVLLLLSNGLDRAANKSLGSPTTDILALLILLPLAHQLLQAQEMINISCGDPQGSGNAAFSTANYAWMIAGGLLWCLILLSIVYP
ncbi:hypothetical protein [Massilia niabensis]|uniref:DUF4234 domain-containing protein n=1 Tax=Massilia niabensis TaxID=544910 RepID=A0ABW0KY59_9BURK